MRRAVHLDGQVTEWGDGSVWWSGRWEVEETRSVIR